MKIVSVERHTSVHGGAEMVAAWILEALKDEHEVMVFGWTEPDFALRNRFYGTSLSPAQVAFEQPKPWVKEALRLAGANLSNTIAFQRFAAFMRLSRAISASSDLPISPLDEFDFGVPGLQYIHYPWLADALGKASPDRRAGRRPWQRISGLSMERVRANGTAANSRFTARILREKVGIEAEVIHPPCPGAFPDRPWDERTDNVVMIGRLVPDKNFDLAVDVVRRVRVEAGDVRLIVIGNSLGVGWRRRAQVRRALESEPWIELREEVDRTELGAVISESRWGIHAMEEEPYGIAVAELVRAGCIPITRRTGGPPEITGEDERLRFDSAEEGAAKLLALMSSETDREQLRGMLRRRAQGLGPDEFVRRIRRWVDSAAGPGGPSAARPG